MKNRIFRHLPSVKFETAGFCFGAIKATLCCLIPASSCFAYYSISSDLFSNTNRRSHPRDLYMWARCQVCNGAKPLPNDPPPCPAYEVCQRPHMAVDWIQVRLLPVAKQSKCPSGLLLHVGTWRARLPRACQGKLVYAFSTVQGLPIESADLATRG